MQPKPPFRTRFAAPAVIVSCAIGISVMGIFAAGPGAGYLVAGASLTGGASVVPQALALGGTMVKFGTAPASATPTPTPTAAPTSTPAPTPAPLQPAGPPGRWTQVFGDEFNGTSLDTTRWLAEDNWSMNNVLNMARNVSVSGGNLVLTLESSQYGAGVTSARYDGAGVNGYELRVGDYAEARVYFPGSATEQFYNWPAWWASGDNWPSAGEHDIVEGLGGNPTVNYHSPSGAHNFGTIPGSWGNAFHTYGVHRKASSADVYWDGVLVKSYPTDDNGGVEALILNVGKSNSRPIQTGAAGQVKVDWVRAWAPAP